MAKLFTTRNNISKFFLLLVLLLLFVLVACSAEGGSTGGGATTFSSTDNSIDEWANVPVFQTDPSGDVTPPDDDIIEIKVANSPSDGAPTDVFFLLKVAGNPALQGKYRAVIATIDCDGNGNDQEPHDRLIVYVPSEDQYYIMRGDQSEFFSGREKDGQVIGDYVEWKVSISDLPPDEKDNVQCNGNVKIRFATADVTDYYSAKPGEKLSKAIVIDVTDAQKGWNIP